MELTTIAQNSASTELIAEIDLLEKEVRETQNMPADLAERALRNIDRLRRAAKRGSYSGEYETIEKYIYWITRIPWGKTTQDNLSLANAKKLMDDTHYGMDTVKNLILDYLSVMQLQINNGTSRSAYSAGGEQQIPQQQVNQQVQPSQPVSQSASASIPGASDFPQQPAIAQPNSTIALAQNMLAGTAQPINNTPDMAILRGSSANAPVMLFVGLQGVGKTSIAKSIASALGRKFVRVSVGAIGSVQSLRGQSRGLLDAEPGQIVKALTRTGTMNPVILLDEIDKASGNAALLSDVMAALLEILDPEQNASFMDHYVDFPVDLSKVFFICTANNLGTLSAALLDRMEVIRFTSYTDAEKEVIAKNYAFPKVLQNMGINADQIVIQQEVWPILIRPVGFDAGLRQLERNLSTLARSAARKILEGAPLPVVITSENVRQFVLPDQGPLS